MKILQAIQAFFDRTVTRIEEDPTPLKRYIFLFAGILSLRLLLEFYSNHRRFELHDILHISLWFTFIVLAFLIQLHLFSGVKMGRLIRLVVVCFSIALSAPIIDLIWHGGVGVKMNYLELSDWKSTLWSYLTVGGPSLSRGATIGIRVEIVLLVLASMTYVWRKTKSIWRAGLGAFSIYTVLFLSGTLPPVLNEIVWRFGLEYPENDQSTLLLLLSMDVALLGFAIWRYAPQEVGKVWRAVPLWQGFMGIVLTGFGFGLGLHMNPGRLTWDASTIFYPLLSAELVGLLWVMQGIQLVQAPQLKVYREVVLALVLMIVLGMDGRILIIVMTLYGTGLFLHEKPLMFRFVPYLGALIQGIQVTCLVVLGWMLARGILIGFPIWVFLASAGLWAAGEMVLFGLKGPRESDSETTLSGQFFQWMQRSGRKHQFLLMNLVILALMASILAVNVVKFLE